MSAAAPAKSGGLLRYPPAPDNHPLGSQALEEKCGSRKHKLQVTNQLCIPTQDLVADFVMEELYCSCKLLNLFPLLRREIPCLTGRVSMVSF